MRCAEAGDDIASRLQFLYELDQLKVLRQSMLADGSRQENSAEHSWHLAMTAMTLTLADEPIDVERAIKICWFTTLSRSMPATSSSMTMPNGQPPGGEQGAADPDFVPASRQQARVRPLDEWDRRPRRPVRLCV